MKKTNIKSLETASQKIADAKTLLEEARGLIEDVQSDEQDAFDNKSEKWQEGEKGEEAQDALTNIENVVEGLGSAEEAIDEAVGYIDDIVNNS